MGLFDYIISPTYQQYLSLEQEFDSRVAPKQLIKELEQKSVMKKFIKHLNKPTSNSLKIIRRIHICNLILLYSDLFAQQLINQVHIPLSQDQWLNDEFIKPYLQFMSKCSNEYQKYKQCKKSFIEQKQIFDQLFFLINLMKLLFKAIKKIALLGKFYRTKNTIVWQGVIEMVAIQAKELYFVFKNILIMILQDTDRYLFTPQLQQIMKNILMQDLSDINEDMKQLLLGKEFFPYGKAIGIKLFRVDEATQQLEDTMRGIVTDHCQTNRRMQKQHMEDKLFNHKNGFNIKFFQQTLRGTAGSDSMFKAFGKNKKQPQKPVSQQVVDSDSQEDPQMQDAKKLADTHESNLNKQVHTV